MIFKFLLREVIQVDFTANTFLTEWHLSGLAISKFLK